MSEDNCDLIYVLNKCVQLYQVSGGFRTSMDSIMLAAACPVISSQSVLDLGCGVGSAGLCVLHRVKDIKLHGIDIQADHIELAKKNAALNNSMADNSSFHCADIRDLIKSNIGTFDHVICNPPYKEAGTHKHSPSPAKAQAMGHVSEDISLRSWIDCAWHHIKGQGSLTIIHEAEHCDSIIHGLYSARGGRRFGHIEIIPLYPKTGIAAKRVIIRAWKHKKSGSSLLPGITLHNMDGSYTAEADNILRGGQALFAL
jgi:tRNA1(Val) A37 N6-methylase TrmN6